MSGSHAAASLYRDRAVEARPVRAPYDEGASDDKRGGYYHPGAGIQFVATAVATPVPPRAPSGAARGYAHEDTVML
jgi:hypothetical protein